MRMLELKSKNASDQGQSVGLGITFHQLLKVSLLQFFDWKKRKERRGETTKECTTNTHRSVCLDGSSGSVQKKSVSCCCCPSVVQNTCGASGSHTLSPGSQYIVSSAMFDVGSSFPSRHFEKSLEV